MANGAKKAADKAKDGMLEMTDVLTGYLNTFLEALPSLAISVVLFLIFWIAANLARNLVASVSESAVDDKSLQNLFGTIARVALIVIGLFASASVLFPGLSAGDLVGVLGLSSVAVGFAFKDIFQNFLAGVLILAQRPFQIGDQIIANDYEGTVEDIHIRSTQIKTYAGERVIIPNSQIYGSAIQVRTAFDKRRTTFQTGIGYGEDIDQGRDVIMEAVEACEGVLDDPAPQIYVSSHGDSAVVFDVRYWTDSHSGSVARAKNEVATRVKYALDDADIEIPYPYRTIEFFDMSDDGHSEPLPETQAAG